MRAIYFFPLISLVAKDFLLVGFNKSTKKITGALSVYYTQAKYLLLRLCAIHMIPFEPGRVEKNDWLLSFSKEGLKALSAIALAEG